MRQWKRYGWVGLAAVAAVGCGDDPEYPKVENEPVQQQARLESFEECAPLEQYIEDTATRRMRASLEQARPRNGGWLFGDGAMPPTVGMPTEGDANSGGDAPRGPTDHTGTNNQVAGVHEADFVQNDGTRIFVLSGPRLYLHRSWPAEQLTLASSMEIQGWPREMLYDKERQRLVITSQVDDDRPGRPTVWGGSLMTGAPVMDCAGVGFRCGYMGGDTLKVTVVDVSDLAAPKVKQQVFLPGSYLSARRVDGAVRLVLSDDFRWPADIRFYPEYSPSLNRSQKKMNEAIDALIAKNEQLIRAQTLTDWVAPGKHVAEDGTVTPLPVSCGDFYRSNAPTGLGFVTVLSLDLDAAEGAAPVGRTSIVSAPGTVYASPDALYLAASHWWWWPEANQSDHTYLHKFDLSAPSRAVYAGSGTLEGSLVNQFAMDEHEGVLRVATTVSTWRVDPNTNGNGVSAPNTMETHSRVVTFGAEGGHLQELGRSEDLASGERIFSARFVGKKGYVVTFRQTDPLFTFDLSDAAHPRKVGELKIPGFSTYIHPLGDTHLLTFGEDRAEDGSWTSRALKLSLFDVSDLAHPKEAFTHRMGGTSSYSDAQGDHKAFNFFPAKGLLALPFTDWDYSGYDYWTGFKSELRVFRVDTATGFTPVGALSMKDVYQSFNEPQWNWYWSPSVRRSVMADDYVYAISDAGIRVSKADSLQTPVATTRFQPPVR
ncbi:beta-propeller domain-containing protein [Myxococcus sp. AM011]|uniref:beta-propeller domain-containing protein n=1 Tax=Myxococcus sp. AM011 TaxID=2745200 RepID=UPI00159567A9|nr:beta-propeller domain-containing protein [Myxococcus sp. AM011]NVJ22283.1 beta-propeller domain-containing protein [Myxococcus sp. AM011]